MRLEIVSTENGYVLRSGHTHQHHPTFVDLMRSILEAFNETTKTEPERIEKEVLIETTKKLIDYLFALHFSPSQIIDVLKHHQEAVQHNVNQGQTSERTVQMRLISEWLVKPAEFTEAPPFPIKFLIPQYIGHSILRNHNGSVAVQRREFGGITVFLNNSDIEKLMAQSKQENYKMLVSAGIPEPNCNIIIEYIEDLKDKKLGVFPIGVFNTRIQGDAGEINAEEHEQAQW